MSNRPHLRSRALLFVTLFLASLGDASSAFAERVVFTHFAGTIGGASNRDGGPTVSRFAHPRAVAVFNDNIYIADSSSHTIRRMTPDGYVTTLAGLAWHAGHTDGAGATARFDSPAGIAVDSSGNLYVSDTGNKVIRKITPSGIVTTIAGQSRRGFYFDGPADQAGFVSPTWITVNSAGDVFVHDENSAQSYVRRLRAGVVSTVISNLTSAGGGVSSPPGSASFFYADPSRDSVYFAKYDGSGYTSQLVYKAASSNESLSYPHAPVAKSDNEVFVRMGLTNAHFVYDATSGWQLVPHTTDYTYAFTSDGAGIALDGAGNVIAAIPGTNIITKQTLVSNKWTTTKNRRRAASSQSNRRRNWRRSAIRLAAARGGRERR